MFLYYLICLFQDFLFAIFGGILYLAVGSKIIAIAIEFQSNYPEDTMDCVAKLKAIGSISIISSFVFFADGILVLKEIKEDSSS